MLTCRAAHVRDYDLHQPMATDPRHEAVPGGAKAAMNLLLDQVMLAGYTARCLVSLVLHSLHTNHP